MAQLTALRQRLDPAEVRDRLAARARTTPGRLNLYLIALITLGVLAGLTAVVGISQRSSAVDRVATASGPLAVQAQGLYRSLSDADATAATAFLNLSEPADLRQRYLNDIAAASNALAATAVSAGVDSAPVARIAAGLPTYTGLIETARTQNSFQSPLAAAYLREASTLMRGTLLPAASQLYQQATDQLAADRSDAAGFPWLAIPLLLLTLAGLVVAQLYLIRHTQRLVNLGLVVASAAGVLLLLWVGGAWIGVAANLSASDRDGSAQVQAVAQVRINALQARTDEALTLIARGSGGAFETDFQARMTQLVGADGKGGTLAAAIDDATDPTVHDALTAAQAQLLTWRGQHKQIRAADDGGDYPGAVHTAVTTSSTTFGQLDAQLQKAIVAAETTFDDRSNSAGNALVGSAAGAIVLTLVLVAGLVVGLQQRIAEYR